MGCIGIGIFVAAKNIFPNKNSTTTSSSSVSSDNKSVESSIGSSNSVSTSVESSGKINSIPSSAENSSSVSISSSIQNSASSSSVSVSPVPSSKTQQIYTIPIKNPKTYTNLYLPDFKLVYPSDWKFETTVQSSEYSGLLNREIAISKKNARFTMNIFPKDKTKYAVSKSSFDVNSLKKIKTFSNGLIAYSSAIDIPSYFYGKPDIPLIYLTSNIKAASFAQYQTKTSSEDKFVNFIVQPKITYYCDEIGKGAVYEEGPCFADKIDEQLQAEVDQIIAQSSFK